MADKTCEGLLGSLTRPSLRMAVFVWVEPGSAVRQVDDWPAVHGYLLHWEDEGIIIPWAKGQTPKDAILEWAKYELVRD